MKDSTGPGGRIRRAFDAWMEDLARRTHQPEVDTALLKMVRPAVRPPPAEGDESTRTVIFALALDIILVVGKAIATAITGSAALFAETLHTLADASNGLMLYRAGKRSKRPPDVTHPYGYGAELYYWCLLAAVIVFTAGGALSIWEGLNRLREPEDPSGLRVGLLILAIGFVLDVLSFLQSGRALRTAAKAAGVPAGRHLRTTTDTTVPAVFLQDGASIIGGLVALTGLLLGHATGSSVPDGVAAIVVGVLLATVAIRLARRNRDLLTLRSDSPTTLRRIHAALTTNTDVADVGRVTTVYIGPHRMLVLAEVQPADGLTGAQLIASIGDLQQRVRAAIPRVAAVFLTPVGAIPAPPPQEDPGTYWSLRFPEADQS